MQIHPDSLALLTEDGVLAIIDLFNDLEDVLFWIKDRRRRIIALNETFAQRVKKPAAEVLGQTDSDLYLPELAGVFRSDDDHVLQTGRSLRQKAELLTTAEGGIEWRSTTKLPLRDQTGAVLGTTGISRPLMTPGDPVPAPYRALNEVVEYARAHLSDGVDVSRIAARAGMSVSSLSRWFKAHLDLTPGEFLNQLRISRACRLLVQSPHNMTEIALAVGYESPAAFSRAFRRALGSSPREFRQKRSAVGT